MNLGSIHVTHRRVGVEELEPLAALKPDEVVRDLIHLDSVEEAAVLQTCNRFEVYVAGPDAVEARGAAWHRVKKAVKGRAPDDHHVETRVGLDSVEHLMRVAAGLESMIVGEDQILGQVKDAYTRSLELGAAGPDVSLAFKKAIAVGKRVRTDTAISRGAVSVGSAAVDLATRILGSLEGKRLLVLGAGEMAELVARSLADTDLGAVHVASRNVKKADHLARKLGGEAVPYREFACALPAVDVIICATAAPHPILTRKKLEATYDAGGPDRDLLVIDISNPRNVSVDVAEVPRVTLKNLDGLERIARENLERRTGEVEKAEDIIRRHLALLAMHLEEREAEAAVRALHREMRRIRDTEYEKALHRLNGVSDADRQVMHDMVTSAMSKLLAAPTLNLKRAAKRGDADAIKALVDLFSLEVEDE